MDVCLWESFVANLVDIDPFVLDRAVYPTSSSRNIIVIVPGLSLTNSRRARLDTVSRVSLLNGLRRAVFSFAIQKSARTSNPSGRSGMNTAINAYTSNYECCYSRDAGTSKPRDSRKRRRRRATEASEKRRHTHTRTLLKLDTAQISVVCALIGLNRPGDPRVRK